MKQLITFRQLIAFFLSLSVIIIARYFTLNIVTFSSFIFLAITSMVFEPLIHDWLKYPYIFHMLLFYYPLYLPLAFGLIKFSWTNPLKDSIVYLISLVAVIVFTIALNFNYLSSLTNSLIVKFPIKLKRLFIELIYISFPIVGEEIFFRGLFIEEIYRYIHYPFLVTIFVSIIFVYFHYINRWSKKKFSIKSYVGQFGLSMILCYVILEGGDLFYCIFLHFLFNIQSWVTLLLRAITTKKIGDN